MPEPKTKKRGGQPANANARKSGFYDNVRKPGFYDAHYTEEELTLIVAFVSDLDLSDEIWMQRVLNRRLLATSGDPDMPVESLVRVVEAMATGTQRIAKLLRDRQALSGEKADTLAGVMIAALDDFRDSLGIDV